MRIIIHADLDSFYASLEEQRKDEIKGKPIVICMFSGRSQDSGAVATANYKARALGIKAGMPIVFAKRRANSDTVFLPADLEYYRSESAKIMEVFESYADSFQQVSIDEAYLDVSSCDSLDGAEQKANEIKEEIRKEFGMTCSIGIAPNKLVAKMASRFRKPDGLTIVEEKDVKGFLASLAVDKLHGVGGKTVEALAALGIKAVSELAECTLEKLERTLGKNKARLLKDKALGIDDSPVTGQVAKQMSRIGTLKDDTKDFSAIYEKIDQLSREMHKKIVKNKTYFRTVSIIIIASDLEAFTRGKTIEKTNKLEDVLDSAKELLKDFLDEHDVMVRRAGIRVSNLVYENGAEKTAERKEGLQRFLK